MHGKELIANGRRYYGMQTPEDYAQLQILSMVEKKIFTRDANRNLRGIDETFEEFKSKADEQGILEPIRVN
jgi:hypothetical protein